MKIRLPISVFLFTVFLSSFLSCPAQDIYFNLVKPFDDNAGVTIFGMTQDAQGYLWFATGNGLYKYDGYQYISYHTDPRNSNSPAAAKIDCVTFDKAGYLWLAPYSLGLDRFDPATGTFTHFRHHNNEPGSLAGDSVKAILQDHEGTLWLATMNGLDKFDTKTNKFIHYKNDPNDPSSLSCNVVFEIYEDKQGTIWVGTGNPFDLQKPKEGGLNKLNKKTGKFTRYMHDDNDPHSLIDNRVRAIFEDSRGKFWVGTAGDGLHTMDRTNGTFERHLYDPLHPDKLSRPPIKNIVPWTADHITFIAEDEKGKIWIGTFQGGLNIYDPATQKVSYYGPDAKSVKKKMADNNFWTAYKTKDNIMWVSTWGNNLFKVKPYETILPHTRIGKVSISFGEDDAHTLWIATIIGLFHINSNGTQEQFLIDKDSSSPANQVIFIEKDADKFWLTTAAGLYLFDPVTKAFFSVRHQAANANSLISDTVSSVKKDIDNTLWIGTANGLDMMDTKTRTFRHFQNNISDTQSISNNQVFSINTDKNQNLWVCTLNGLNRLDKKTGHFKRYLSQFTVYSVFEDNEGDLWAAAEAGLFKYDKESDNFLNFIDESSVLSATSTAMITEDHDQNLWISTSKGIVRLNKQSNSAILYGKNQGVNNGVLTGFAFTRQDGEILFSDTSGYYNFQPGTILQNVSAPIVNIGKFFLNNIPVQPSSNGILSLPLMQTTEIRLNHNQNTFSFEFTNIDFNSEHEDAHLLYMLQNYDKAWRKAGEEKTAYYFNLPPAKYIFKVKALNASGIATEKDIVVSISPPWWNTWWAYAIFVLSFAALLWAFIAYRSRKLKRENIILEEKVTSRTMQLDKSLKDLTAAQAQLIQSEKMASLGALTAGIAHEIQNPLNFMNNFSEVNTELIEEMKIELKAGNNEGAISIANDIADNEQKINHHGKRADAIVKGMLQHSQISTRQKESTDINKLADEYLRLSYHGLRSKDKSFNATLQTDFDETIGKINIIPQDIGRVLLNLFNNAFYAVNEKTKTAEGNYLPIVTVQTKKLNTHVEIKVSDNGNGIPQKIVDKIFQPFFTTKPTGQGTGLGLSLSYDIIKSHGGELNVETTEGKEAIFSIHLPI